MSCGKHTDRQAHKRRWKP